jgi:hypothetical protein
MIDMHENVEKCCSLSSNILVIKVAIDQHLLTEEKERSKTKKEKETKLDTS